MRSLNLPDQRCLGVDDGDLRLLRGEPAGDRLPDCRQRRCLAADWRPSTSMLGTVRVGRIAGCKALSLIANGMLSGSAASGGRANAATIWPSWIRSGSRASFSSLPAPVMSAMTAPISRAAPVRRWAR